MDASDPSQRGMPHDTFWGSTVKSGSRDLVSRLYRVFTSRPADARRLRTPCISNFSKPPEPSSNQGLQGRAYRKHIEIISFDTVSASARSLSLET